MAVTTSQSAAVAAAAAGKPVDAINYHCERADYFFIDATQGAAAGDIGSTMDIAVLPPGRWRFIGVGSYLATSAFGASRTLSIGHTGWTKPDGTVVAASAAALDSAKDVSGAIAGPGGYSPAGALTADGTLLIETRTPVTIQAVVAGGTIPAAATIKGLLKFMRG